MLKDFIDSLLGKGPSSKHKIRVTATREGHFIANLDDIRKCMNERRKEEDWPIV